MTKFNTIRQDPFLVSLQLVTRYTQQLPTSVVYVCRDGAGKGRTGRGNDALWKPWKAKGRLPTVPTNAWKSQKTRFPHSHRLNRRSSYLSRDKIRQNLPCGPWK